MGRILRLALVEDTPTRVDLAMVRPGKLLIKNTSATLAVRIAYETVGGLGAGTGLAGAQNYYSLGAGNEYVFDCGPGVGVVAQNQSMFFAVTGGTATVEIWVATD